MIFFFSQPLNVWVGLTSQWTALFWTGLIEPDQRPLDPTGGGNDVGRVIYSECYWVACSVWGAERIMRLYHSIDMDWHCRARKTSRHSTWWLREIAQTFLIHLVWNAFPTLSQINSTPSLLLPFLRKPVRAYACVCVCARKWACMWVCVCVRDKEKERVRCLLYQCFVNFLDALHMRAIGVVLKIVNLLFRMSLHPSKSK